MTVQLFSIACLPVGGGAPVAISYGVMAPPYAHVSQAVAPVSMRIGGVTGHPHTGESARYDVVRYENGAQLRIWLGDGNIPDVSLKLPEGRSVKEAKIGTSEKEKPLSFKPTKLSDYPLGAKIPRECETMSEYGCKVLPLRIVDDMGNVYLHNIILEADSTEFAPRDVSGDYYARSHGRMRILRDFATGREDQRTSIWEERFKIALDCAVPQHFVSIGVPEVMAIDFALSASKMLERLCTTEVLPRDIDKDSRFKNASDAIRNLNLYDLVKELFDKMLTSFPNASAVQFNGGFKVFEEQGGLRAFIEAVDAQLAHSGFGFGFMVRGEKDRDLPDWGVHGHHGDD